MKYEEGIFSTEEIRKYQKLLTDKQKQKSLVKYGLYYEEINNSEPFVISTRLTNKIAQELHIKYGHIGVKKLFNIFRENYINENDL